MHGGDSPVGSSLPGSLKEERDFNDESMFLGSLLKDKGGSGYCLAMAPGFFRKYAYVGALSALEEAGHWRVLTCAGSSAGAIVSAFVGAGFTPVEMTDALFNLRREDFWDPALFSIMFGLLRGNKLQETFRDRLPTVQNMEDCVIPIGVTAYDALRFKTRVLQRDIPLCRAVAASCSVPVMFQPVTIASSPHYDGGIFDCAGMMALPAPLPSSVVGTRRSKRVCEAAAAVSKRAKVPKTSHPQYRDSCLVLNLVCDASAISSSVLPEGESFPEDTTLVTVVLQGVPAVSPFDMRVSGPRAHDHARRGLAAALASTEPMEEHGPRHYVCYVECSGIANV
jgi:hypothetical protein